MIRRLVTRLVHRSTPRTEADQVARTMRELRRQSTQMSRTQEHNDYLTDDMRYAPYGDLRP